MKRLLVVGSSNTDLTVQLPALPTPGQTVIGGTFSNGPGGKGANQAVAAARAGASVVFVTAVGDDAYGTQALRHYESEGLDVRHARRHAGVSSGVALILVGEAGENLIGVASGANAKLSAADVAGLPEALFERGGVLLVAGLEIPLEAAGAAIDRGARAGMTVVLNPAPASPVLHDWPALRRVDLITPNRGELATLIGLAVARGDDLRTAARALRALGPRLVVVTLGGDGCLIVDETGEAVSVPARPVEAVDTVGAGDAFNGALAVALAEGKPLERAVAWANAAAAVSVTRAGAQTSLPTRVEIDG